MDDRLDRQKAHFDNIAERYDKARSHPNHLALKQLIWSDFFGKFADSLPATIRMLEPMCGFADGRSIVSTFLDKKIEYSGFDYSSEVVDRLLAKNPDVNVWQQDVSTFESERQFDLIILLGGLHHVPHVAGDVVSRLADCLAPGGVFINLEPTHGNPLFRWARESIYRRNSLFDETTERAFSVSELRGFFTDAGLEAGGLMYPGLLAYILYYNPDAFPALNVGRPGLVKAIWTIERPLVRTFVARGLSFETLSMWSKPA